MREENIRILQTIEGAGLTVFITVAYSLHLNYSLHFHFPLGIQKFAMPQSETILRDGAHLYG